jgi:hypothetical protein
MFSLPEYQLLRAGLDAITIKGADAQFLAQLQIKIEQELQQLSQLSVEKSKPTK